MESFIILVGLGVILVVVVSVSFRLIEMRSRTVSQLYRVEAKLDLLLKQANIEFDPYANLPREVADAARAGKTIQAIKLYRQSSEASLKEAKDFIEEYQRRVK
jgi:ribosomal protein L7/L12